MDPQTLFNLHHTQADRFPEIDHHLSTISKLPYYFKNPTLDKLPTSTPGIYSIGGGRQVGKTTLLKQWMEHLLSQGIDPKTIVFYTGELIHDHHALIALVRDFIHSHQHGTKCYVILDEVTYIKEWEKGVKFMADAGLLSNTLLIITGSDLSLIKSARMTFPGRRGNANQVDFHIYPLSFKETLLLKNVIINTDNPSGEEISTAYEYFSYYLMHGGYLTAINDIAQFGKILPSTLQTYSDWIRGDILKRAKQEHYLIEILTALYKRYQQQVSWNSLADDTSIDSHKTVQDYCGLLEEMDALLIQPALLMDKLTAAPKKARKISFKDPFIYHALKAWLNKSLSMAQDIEDNEISAALVESAVAGHINRDYPCYYIKAKGEIDIVYVKNEKCFPIEVKWRNQLRPEDIKNIKPYPNAELWAKTYAEGEMGGHRVIPLPLALLRWGI